MEQITLRDMVLTHMKRIRQWSVFVVALGYISVVVSMVIAIAYWGVNDGLVLFGGIDVTDVIFAAALGNMILTFFPTFFLTLFARNLKRFELSEDGDDLEFALFYLRRYVSFIGIMLILVLLIFFFWLAGILNFAFLF